VDIDVTPSGAGLPAGSGTAEQGATVYATNCASCHGANGEGKPPAYPQLIGGPKGTFDFASDFKIPRTVGNYWPYATTLFDYIRRAMPLAAPGSLTADQTYAVTAYLLNREGIIPAGTSLDAKSLAAIRMPAQSHFVADDRRGSTGGKNVR
jgi:cytochrome c